MTVLLFIIQHWKKILFGLLLLALCFAFSCVFVQEKRIVSLNKQNAVLRENLSSLEKQIENFASDLEKAKELEHNFQTIDKRQYTEEKKNEVCIDNGSDSVLDRINELFGFCQQN